MDEELFAREIPLNYDEEEEEDEVPQPSSSVLANRIAKYEFFGTSPPQIIPSTSRSRSRTPSGGTSGSGPLCISMSPRSPVSPHSNPDGTIHQQKETRKGGNIYGSHTSSGVGESLGSNLQSPSFAPQSPCSEPTVSTTNLNNDDKEVFETDFGRVVLRKVKRLKLQSFSLDNEKDALVKSPAYNNSSRSASEICASSLPSASSAEWYQKYKTQFSGQYRMSTIAMSGTSLYDSHIANIRGKNNTIN